ncbi:uncharacterized protein JCM10292_007329 [Rhodotorula paludigena]|uniref:uncharacterized protein n=1 Tax=Rhodotorula paludigena TaxID=86838 RepID=UPI0031784478
MDQVDTQQHQDVKTDDLVPKVSLLSLPFELLHKIFDEVYSTRPPSVPACRALLPFHDAHFRSRFATVKVHRPDVLVSFQKSLDLRKNIGAVCTRFSFVRGHLPAVPAFHFDAARLFSALPNLEYLRLEGDQLVRAVFEYGSQAVLPFRQLQTLTLQAALHDCGDPYQPSHFQAIPPSVRQLTLLFEGAPSAALTVGAPSDELDLSSVDKLELWVLRASSSASRLVQSCSSLAELVLSGDMQSSALIDVLAAATKLDSVESLTLQGTTIGWKIPKAVKYADDITSLTLGRGCRCADKPSFDILRGLPLEHLSFGSQTVVASAHLLSLVDGASRIKALNSLELDNVSADLGDILAFEWKEEPGCVSEWLSEGFALPKWTKTFSRVAVVEIKAACEAQGIEYSGTTFEAPTTEDRIGHQRRAAKRWLDRRNYGSEWGYGRSRW